MGIRKVELKVWDVQWELPWAFYEGLGIDNLGISLWKGHI